MNDQPSIPSHNPDLLKPVLAQLADGQTLSVDQSRHAFEVIMSGAATPSQIGAFLMALRLRGETVEEITGAAQVMRAKALSIQAPANAVDTCGTGGDASGTYNISTAAAIVVAALGVPVAKHGNRAMSSKSGSAEVLKALGVDIDADMSLVEQALKEANICFLMAPRHHAAMRFVGPTRVEMGMRTIFNLLGPLSNPAGTKRQLLGVFSNRWVEPLAKVAGALGNEKVWVVHGGDGLDELTTTGPSQVAEWNAGKVRLFEVEPESFGLKRAESSALKGADATVNAAAMRKVFEGQKSAYRDIVVLNAAATLVVADKARQLSEGVEMAQAALDEGKALATLNKLIEVTNRPKPTAAV